MCSNRHSSPQHPGRCLAVYRGRLEGSLGKNKRNKRNYLEEKTLHLEEKIAKSSINGLKTLLAIQMPIHKFTYNNSHKYLYGYYRASFILFS